jgi:tetratricopeptide (TPR) repeat protein
MSQSLDIANLEKLHSENPESSIFAFLAFRNLEQGNMQKALLICQEGIKNHPEYPFGHFVLGLCHYHLKDYSKAKTHLEISTAYDNKNPQAWKLLGEINEQLNLPILAEECNLKYYLADSFNTDALEKYQKGEIIDFDVFKEAGETDYFPPKKQMDEEEKLEAEAKFENLFDKQLEEEKSESTFSEKEEDLLDKEAEDSFASKDEEELRAAFKNKDDDVIEERPQSQPDEDKTRGDFAEKDEALKAAFKNKDNDEMEETAKNQPEEYVSDEDKIRDDFAEKDEAEDLLDYRSVIKDIISENEDDTLESTDTDRSEEKVVEKKETQDSKFEQTLEEDDEESVGKSGILSPTIGEIYISQGRFDDAIDVFRRLLEKEPDNPKFQKKINDIKLIIEKQKAKGD